MSYLNIALNLSSGSIDIKTSPDTPYQYSPTRVRRSASMTADGRQRFIYFTAQNRRGTGSRPDGVYIPSLFTQRHAPSLSVPKPKLNIINPLRPTNTVRRSGGRSGVGGGARVNLTIRTPYGATTLSLSGSARNRFGLPSTTSGAVKVVASAFGVPTTIGGALSAVARVNGLPTSLPPLNEALNTLGIPTNIKVDIGNLGLEFPKLPAFPGLDMAGLTLGAGPKFAAEQISKYKSIIPPFAPGLKINMGIALAAMSVIRALMKSNPSDLLKHLLSQVVDDIAGQVMDQVNDAIDQTGINDALGKVKDQVGGVLNGAQGQFEINFVKNNPPRTEYDEDGNPIEIRPEMPDSGIPTLDEAIPEKPSVQISIGVSASAFSSQNSQQRAYTYPPNR